MTRSYKSPNQLLLLIFMLLTGLLWSCGGGGGSGTYTNGSGGSGTLSLSLTDAATERYKAVYVTIDAIQIHLRGTESNPNNWLSVDMPVSPMTVNLLELVNGVREDLGLADLAAGRYSQMRLIIGPTPDTSINMLSHAHPYANYVIDHSDTAYPLKIPSGFNTGIKIVKGFRINANQTTELILDFDADRSVVEAGSSGKRLLKPTIAVQDASEYAIIEGIILTAGDPTIPLDPDLPIENARISAQVHDSALTDPADQIIIKAATLSDATGEFRLFVAPGTYNLVVYADGFEAAVVKPFTVESGKIYPIDDLQLNSADTATISGTIDFVGQIDQYVTLSFRQEAAGDMIEIKALNTMASTYAVELPAGTFQIVASSYGHTTSIYSDIVAPGIQDISVD